MKIIATACILAFLALSPRWILRGLSRDEYRAILAPPQAEWRGKIEVWHIAEFRVYQGSVTDYLQARADAFCKTRPGVHIEVDGLTVKRYNDRIARGAVPDAYSFPSGLVYLEQLRQMPFAGARFRGALRVAGTAGDAYAVPYLMSGYFLAANTQLLAKYGVTLPETADAAFLQSALDSGYDPPQLAIDPVPGARLGLTGAVSEPTAFAKGTVMLAVLDARALGDILRGEESALLVDAIPFAAYTDKVLYLGAARDTDDARAGILAEFAAFLTCEEEQQRLSTLGALPVAVTETPVQYADERLAALERAYHSPVVPDPFAYERHREALLAEAALALAGDAAAKASFFERMAVVESGIF